MDYSVNIFNLLIAFAMLQGFFLSVLLVIKSRFSGSHFYLGLTVFFLSSYLVWVLKYDFGFQNHMPMLQYLPVFFLWGIGPSFYLYLKELFGEKVAASKKRLHFLPLLLEQLYFNSCTLICYLDDFKYSNHDQLELLVTTNIFSVEHVVGLVSIAFYLLKSYSYLKRNNVFHASNKIRSILILFAGIWVVWVPYTIFDIVYYDFGFPPSEFYAFYIVFGALIVGVGFLGFNISDQTVAQVAIKSKTVDKKELDKLAELLVEVMKQKQLYFNPSLDLSVLSEEMGLHPNKISAVVNQSMGMSFRDFVNSYRIREFKASAETYDFSKKTVLGLAYECGFNSKASFNRAFRKSENCSPIEYVSRSHFTK